MADSSEALVDQISNADGQVARLRDVRLTLPSPAGPVNVLAGVDLDVRAGEFVSVVGPSGSGKTTLLMVMSGLERPSSGLVEVHGQNLSTLNEDGLARFRRGRLGIVFQAFHLIATLTALENVSLPLELACVPRAGSLAAQALASVGLSSRLDHYPAQLSGGEQQRVALARAFAPSPRLVLADEPTGNLDAATGASVMELLFSLLRQTGSSLILVTHDPGLAARADRIAHMADGRITSIAPSPGPSPSPGP